MAIQEIGCVDIQLSEERTDTDITFSSLTSVRVANTQHHNGSTNNNFGDLLSGMETLEADSNSIIVINDFLPSQGTKMPSEVIDIPGSCNDSIKDGSEYKILEDNVNSCSDGFIIETIQNSTNDSRLERADSSGTSSTDSSNTDDLENTSSSNNDEHIDFLQDYKKHNCLHHPAYSVALGQLEERQRDISDLDNTVARLKDLLSAEEEKCKRIEDLEQRLAQNERELSLSRKEQEIERKTFETIKKENENKCSLLKKDFETANREKESMVMRYAVSEKELIDAKKEKETLLKKVKEFTKENESLQDKVKILVSEKTKISQALDTKAIDLSNSNKEIDKLKEEINSRDIKIKWTQNKLKTEMDTHKECPAQIDKLMIKVRNLEEELTSTRLENQNIKKELQDTEQNKLIESQLKEERAKLIMEKHEHSEVETKYKGLQSKHKSIIEENNSLSIQVQRLETERLETDKKLSSSREETERLSNTVTDLQSKLVLMDTLSTQLKQSEEKVLTLLNEMDRVRHQNEELLQDMSACRARETEMLSFTEKITTKNVQLQSEFTAVETKACDLEKSEEKSHHKLRDLKQEVSELQSQLNKEKARREEETKLLARQVAERTKKGELVQSELLDTKAALTQTKQKNSTVIKTCNLSPQNLVERILKLQADNAKQAEKTEFLKEQSAHLLGEVQRKSRLLQSYILREEAGALAPSFIDNHKAEVLKHGGIMASLYGATPQDEGISLELCLEINRKLQAVLEDTLLKNMMLKENIDTLGDEISRLTAKK